MYSIRNILVTTDFSDYSAVAVEYASSLASLCGAHVHLLHVVEESSSAGFRSVGKNLETALRDREAQAEKEMEKFAYWRLKEDGLIAKVIRRGRPHEEIVRYAEEEGMDLIVIATHGRSGLSRLLLGSIAEKVVRNSKVPVLTVKPPELREPLITEADVKQQLHL